MHNTPGSFNCTCNSGFTGNSVDCSGMHTYMHGLCNTYLRFFALKIFRANFFYAVKSGQYFNEYSFCLPTYPVCLYTYLAVSHPAYITRSFSLSDINECTVPSPCHAQATCININGSFTCMCNNGYSGDGLSCIGEAKCVQSALNTHV